MEKQLYEQVLAGVKSKESLSEAVLIEGVFDIPKRFINYIKNLPAYTRGRRAADKDPVKYKNIQALWKKYEDAEESGSDKEATVAFKNAAAACIALGKTLSESSVTEA